MGHYERFIDEDLNKFSNLTTGKVYWNVLNKERRGEYLGETIQVIPHITSEIKSFIYSVGQKSNADVVITEIGGTAGDIEIQPFLEAIRQVSQEVGAENSLFIHVTLVPYLKSSGEHKSKPTQHSVKELQSMGIKPDIIVLRTDEPITDPSIFHKIALFCNVRPDCVIENLTIPVLYEAPIMLEKSHFSEIVCRELELETPEPDMAEWLEMVERIRSRKQLTRIALVGKYVKLHDAYLSVMEALRHAAMTTAPGWRSTGWIPRPSPRRTWPPAWGTPTASSSPAALDPGIEGWCWPPSTPGSATCPSWASAWACRSPSSSSAGTCAASRTPTPASSTSTACTRSLTLCPTKTKTSTRAAPCGWAAIPARSSPAPG